MQRLLLCVVLFSICAGCKTYEPGKVFLQKPEDYVTEEQWGYVKKYSFLRGVALKLFNIPPNASEDEIRQGIAEFAGYSREASWAILLEDLRAQAIFTEVRRKDLVEIFELSADATWLDLKDRLEHLRRVYFLVERKK